MKITHFIKIFALTFVALLPSQSSAFPQKASHAIASSKLNEGANVVNIDGCSYTVTVHQGKPIYIQRQIFADALHKIYDSNLLRYVEEAYAYHTLGDSDNRFRQISFTEGSWRDFDNIGESTPFSFVNNNSREAILTWEGDQGNTVMKFPISYDIIKGGTRTEIEDRFISQLKDFKSSGLRSRPKFSPSDLQEVEKNLLQLTGKNYMMPGINRNVYLAPDKDGNPKYIFSHTRPLPTMANLVVIGTNNIKPKVDIKVLKHEYGKTETVNVTLESLLQFAALDGCEPFWGFESYEDDILKGVIFLYNETEGYDHVIRIECDTRKLTADNFNLTATASLYVPTNNVSDLFHKTPTTKKKHERFKIK